MKKVIIIGNGPAGSSAALYAVRAGIDTLVIGNNLGSLAKADKIENYYGFETPVSGKDLVEKGLVQVKRLGAKILNEQVVGIHFDDTFLVRTDKGDHTADAVIIATGSSRNAPPIKGLKELEGQGVSYCAICDAFFYRGKDVAVLGNGEYALNEVKELLPIVGTITVLTNGEEPVVEFPSEVTVNKKAIKGLDAAAANLLSRGRGPLEAVVFEDESRLEITGLFIAYGSAGSTALARKIGAFTDGNKIVVDANMATNVPGLFAAGDCVGGLLQISKAVSDGAIAGTSVAKYLREK
ncbi:NAD(P)/FAD-dependent oxidoreductase [Clostridium aminobutyricum]|uniref:FAD-dependent oxidoreductase n=1 Tax=Clostridium aminobutyricum TaxID=33953 RepID=A0A939DAM0_CLOAM|nr:FAD-dependent oxidoreductase [Clostridium aminobutyricum]MBN7774185.1 FAD-dependent oxidoreductase [Clostridium aminobutyricum]